VSHEQDRRRRISVKLRASLVPVSARNDHDAVSRTDRGPRTRPA
jgi:hypothetical protein